MDDQPNLDPMPAPRRNSSKELAELYTKRNACDAELQEIDDRIAARDQKIAQLLAEVDVLKADSELDRVYKRDHVLPVMRGVLHAIHAVETSRASE